MNDKQSELVIIIRPSFKKVCGPDACRAGLFNHILYRLARKAKNEPEKDVQEGNIFWFASAEDICQDIDEAWCVNKVRKEVKKLVESGLLGQRHNPIKKWDRKFQYFISEEQGKKLLERCQAEGICLMHIGLNAEVLHLLHMVNAFNKNGGCICQKEEMDLPYMGNASTINGGAIPEGSQPKGSTEESLLREEESEHEQSIPSPIASALSELDAAPPSSPPSEHGESDTHSQQQGDTHGLLLPPGHFDVHSALERNTAPDTAQNAFGDTHGTTPPQLQAGTGNEQCPHVGDMVTVAPSQNHATAVSLTPPPSPQVAPIVERRSVVVDGPLSAVTCTEQGATVALEVSHTQDRDASHTSGAVEDGGPGSTPPPAQAGPGASSPKWGAAAMVARAEALREKPFSEHARPKETKSAGKLFARKPDLTMEEFERAWQRWDTQWWHENNGLFTITDLAAVPKNKSEMRLIIAFEQLALPKKPPGERVITLPVARGQQWRSSFDDPDYDMTDEFYPGTVAR